MSWARFVSHWNPFYLLIYHAFKFHTFMFSTRQVKASHNSAKDKIQTTAFSNYYITSHSMQIANGERRKPIEFWSNVKRKKKTSDSVLWKKPVNPQKNPKSNVATQKTPPKSSITQWLRTDLGRSVWVTTATQHQPNVNFCTMSVKPFGQNAYYIFAQSYSNFTQCLSAMKGGTCTQYWF